MDNAFPYSTDARTLQKNFYPVNFGTNSCKTQHKKIDLEYPSYHDIDPLYIPPAFFSRQQQPDMNIPRFPESIFAPTEYGMDYQLTAPKLKGYSTKHREGYYMNVYGRPARTTLNFPYVLQVYTPKPFEQTFQTKESALTMAPQAGEWQIVNVFTGQHVYSPRRVNSHSYLCE